MTIRVLLVDGSAAMRALLTGVIGQASDIDVVASTADAAAAAGMLQALSPDLLLVDADTPSPHVRAFLDEVMHLRPTPVILLSRNAGCASGAALRALELGVVDHIEKPRATAGVTAAEARDLHERMRAACGARGKVVRDASPLRVVPPAPPGWGDRLICIGASTGGTEAIKEVLCRLPDNAPGVVMVQHMPEMFTSSFARRLDSLARVRVKEAEHGERILPGHAYLAPGHSHLEIRRAAGGYVCELLQTPPYNRHRPAVDVLFNAAAAYARGNAVAALLTGMGKDGAQGLLAMRRAGAWTIGQDQASCVVYGMPREAAQIGACCEVIALPHIAERIMAALSGGRRQAVHA
ncbi:MAG: chemotaxis-specific protein-glutamate methyltransferase CheB [Gammaproteobacteria bacterium]|jgi:two-component system, chemotaxis family, protein-glutamate methylesterase/glutaminase|nr:chemotaxis-specific protein-glutamate methyltransferase CheB [Gammaproteobacteria bacterium]MBU0770689.1 chemotaxis-specific protein-glutamate methyltransferase CheB [Gammaproteobacteria bacterium]MBU0857563.1 chemotaxis-specific protein-glutamate methyltransferase CheB [Gammaproteobacteria bacterium]MBU1848693.1 chemotaxis-specific protein-glutamate methyltransferase CheB [Gammaproteobacteria bacterium]